jgi:hypothetical protein
MKTRGWECWLIVSFLADAVIALFIAIAAMASSLCHRQYAYQAG